MNVHGIISVCNQFSINNVKQTNPLNIERDDRTKKIFQITFDIHQDNTYVNYCLATLKKYNIKATFFLTNNFIKKFPQDVLNILKDGHIIGNHAKHIFFKSPADVYKLNKRNRTLF
jgi:peptidoglycan/xylan/chitin deacetylase (PgdA/CDA1 family)